jgi:hypothetical protein
MPPEHFTSAQAIDNARRILAARYPDALFAVAAGSIVRGEGGAFSDLDLTIIFPQRECARRESFVFDGMQIEAFLHDPETIQAFIDDGMADTHVTIVHMLATGVLLPEGQADGLKMQSYCQKRLAAPVVRNPKTEDTVRYFASDLIDDLKDPRPVAEQRAIMYALYPRLAELRLRTASAVVPSAGKHLARKLQATDAGFYAALDAVMVHAHGDRGLTPADVAVLEKLLDSVGGYLFDGYGSSAPADKRMPPKWRDG